MARLTNRQLDALAARVTDLLQEAHDAKVKEVVQSPEYLNFEKEYTDEFVSKLRVLVQDINTYELEIEVLKNKIAEAKNNVGHIYKEIHGSEYSRWGNPEAETTLNGYLNIKKTQIFKETIFDRDKTLRRVEADILLSDVANPEELVRSLVEKLKTDANIK